MLAIPFGQTRLCDGVSRRNFLKVGAFAFGAANLTLADVLRAEAAAKKNDPFGRTRHKAVINIFLGGGPPHQDMWDIKTEAPTEIRGEFKPIARRCPASRSARRSRSIAAMADKFAVHPLGRRGRRRARRLPVHDRLDAGFARGDGRAAEHRQCVMKVAGPRRSVRAAVRRPRGEDAARAVERRRAGRVPRQRVRRVQAERPGHGQHGAQRRQRRPPAGPQEAARGLRRHARATSIATGGLKGADAATERRLRRAHLEQAGRGARPLEGEPEDPRPLRRRQAVPVPVRRRADGERTPADGPPAGRSRGAGASR